MSLVISIIVAVLILKTFWAFITGAARFAGWFIVTLVVLSILRAL